MIEISVKILDHFAAFTQRTKLSQLHTRRMEHFAVDPRVYGVEIRAAPQVSKSDDASNKEKGDKTSSDASRNSPPVRLSSVSSVAPPPASSARQSTVQPVDGTQTEGVSHTLSSSLMTASTSSAVDASRLPKRRLASTDQQEKLEARKERSEQNRKRIRRENIARQVGHEVDSDGEREYWQASHDRLVAEEARRQALSPEAQRKEDNELSAKALRSHIKPQLTFHHSGLARLYHYPLFVLQTAPDSRNGAACRLMHCTDRITPGQYRIALSPGSSVWRSPDYYHVECFEELLDLSSPHYVARFEPDRRKHIPDHGAQCILEEYISRWKLRLKHTREIEENTPSSSDANVSAPSSSEQMQTPAANSNTNTMEQQVTSPRQNNETDAPRQISLVSDESPAQTQSVSAAVSQSLSASRQTAEADVWSIADTIWAQGRQAEAEASKEHRRLHDLFLTIDSPGDAADPPQDQDQTWHITQYLLPETDPDYDERHALSQALDDWDLDTKIATSSPSVLTEAGRAAQAALGAQTIKKIERYRQVWMPDYQSAFLAGLGGGR